MTTSFFTASPLLVHSFVGVVLVTTLALVFGLERYGASRLATLALSTALSLHASLALGLAQADLLLSLDPPPRPLGLFFGAVLLLVLAFRAPSLRRALDHVPLGGLVLFQAFRLPLELVMHLAADEGVMPRALSFSGRNFDVVTGILALGIGVGLLTGKLPEAAAWVFNVIGSVLLVNVVVVAILTAPGFAAPRVNDVPNVWVAYAPFVLLPGLLVPFAAYGHYEIFRRLFARKSRTSGSGDSDAKHLDDAAVVGE